MSIAKELERHAAEELSQQSEDAETMMRADLKNETDAILNYRARLRECESLGEFAIAEDIREILRQEQEHLIDLATALGENAHDLSGSRS